MHEAKARAVATVLVGHVTKDGGLAGPRVLEHIVDTVVSFEGDRHHALRLLRAVKHRFGSTDELGLFEMITEDGLQAVPDASGLFLSDRRPGVSGSVVVPTMEGQRPMLVEVQGLVVASSLPASCAPLGPGHRRRPAAGMLLAVLGPPGPASTSARTTSTLLAVGGVKLVDPGVDLGVALALAFLARRSSSRCRTPPSRSARSG